MDVSFYLCGFQGGTDKLVCPCCLNIRTGMELHYFSKKNTLICSIYLCAITKLLNSREISLSPGGQNVLIKKIIDDFCPLFTPGGRLMYVGDTETKWAYLDSDALEELAIEIEEP